MKATGIVRRVDDLGRILIPREIRNAMKIREGDPLELFIGGDDSLIIKCYRPMEVQMKEAALAMLNALSERGITDVAVYDRFGLIIHNCKNRKPDLSVPDAVKTHSVTPAITRLSAGENLWVRVLSEHGEILGYIIGDDCDALSDPEYGLAKMSAIQTAAMMFQSLMML